MATIIYKNCQHCQCLFTTTPQKKNKKFCSNSCVGRFRRKSVILDNCMNCGKKLSSIQKKFCGTSCSATYNNITRTNDSREKQRLSLLKKLQEEGRGRTEEKEIFYRECNFGKWKKDVWSRLPGYENIHVGLFHPTKNPNGLVRDHLVSKFDALKEGYDPKIISHPGNCRLISNLENILKGSKSSITYRELLERVTNW